MRHLRLALRTLFKTPFVTAVAVLSLALGIGANAAIFSLFDQLLMRPLPVPHPKELVTLSAPGPNPGMQSCNQAGNCDETWSYPMFRDLEKQQRVLTGIAAHRLFGASLSYKNEPLTGDGVFVSGSYFNTLQLTPTIGRLLGPSDDETIGGHFVTVLGYNYWASHFGSDRSVLGQTITVNGHPFEVIGVAPKNFEGTTLGARPMVYVPITMQGVVEGYPRYDNRKAYWIYLFGRLKEGVTREQAAKALTGIYQPIIRDVEAALQQGMSDKTMARFKAKEVKVEEGSRGQSQMHQEAKTPLALLFGVTAIVLLIACANIANLLLARGANRATEMGVRLALGAGRRQLMVQLLTESVLLALMGGLAGLLVARWTLHGIWAMLPPEAALSLQFELQPSVLWFSALVSLLTGLVFGMFPAVHSTRSDLIGSIRAGAGQITGHRGAARFRSALVTVQIALATALLVGAGLFMKSLINVARVELGVKVDNVVTFSISPERTGYDSLRAAQLFERVEETFAALPGVNGVTTSLVPLLAGSNWGTDVEVQGFQSGPDIDNNARFNEVGAGYFHTLGVPLLKGREFTAADRIGAPRVAVINEAFVKKFHLGDDPIGKFMSDRGPDSMNIQIVGLIKDAKYSSVKDSVPALFYMPWRQDSRVGDLNFYLRTSLAPEELVRQIPVVMKQIDPGLPVENAKTMPQQIRENVFLDRMISILSTAFAVLATLLAAVGLYGVLAYTVAQRTREIGVRMALGADASKVRAMVMRQVAGMIAVGLVVGVAGAIALGKAASSLLYGLKGHDPVVFALSVLVLLLVALSAGYLPALRASKVHPMQALRYD